MDLITVVIPVKNEMKHGGIDKILKYQDYGHLELLWVCGESNDGTISYLQSKNQKVIEGSSNSRGKRMSLGIKMANSDLVLLNHPRSFLEASAFNSLRSLKKEGEFLWGGFSHQFHRANHPLLKFTSWYSNKIRFDLKGIIYLDHCIFFDKKNHEDLYKLMPSSDIFEDTKFCKELKKLSKPVRLSDISLTSPVRFQKNGVWRQAIMNQVLKIGYWFKFSDKIMNTVYEKGLNLNSEYKSKRN